MSSRLNGNDTNKRKCVVDKMETKQIRENA